MVVLKFILLRHWWDSKYTHIAHTQAQAHNVCVCVQRWCALVILCIVTNVHVCDTSLTQNMAGKQNILSESRDKRYHRQMAKTELLSECDGFNHKIRKKTSERYFWIIWLVPDLPVNFSARPYVEPVRRAYIFRLNKIIQFKSRIIPCYVSLEFWYESAYNMCAMNIAYNLYVSICRQ